MSAKANIKPDMKRAKLCTGFNGKIGRCMMKCFLSFHRVGLDITDAIQHDKIGVCF
jgi:hypothetical protein